MPESKPEQNHGRPAARSPCARAKRRATPHNRNGDRLIEA